MKVIFVIADSFRRDHLGVYGNKWIRTPNLDKFAKISAVFEKAHNGSFPTVPYRRDVILGHGDKGVAFNRWKRIDDDEVTVPARLAEKKIPSMLITDTQNTVTRAVNLYRDFTAWTLNRGQEGDPHWMDATVPLTWPVPHPLIRYTEERWRQILVNRAHRNTETDWFAPGTYSLAIRWLEKNYRRDDFLLWMETFDPHEPWDPPQHYIDMYDPGYEGRVFDAPTYGLRKKIGITDRELRQIRARYAGEVSMVDTWFGNLLATLERLQILDETFVIFTSDHGIMLDEPGDHARERSLHPGDDDDHAGPPEPGKLPEQPVESGDPDIKEGIRGQAERLGADDDLPGDLVRVGRLAAGLALLDEVQHVEREPLDLSDGAFHDPPALVELLCVVLLGGPFDDVLAGGTIIGGDGVGKSRGIVGASLNGLMIANGILKLLGKN
jgi:hypothetical protein